MKKVALFVCLLALSSVLGCGQAASGKGSVGGSGSIMVIAGHSVTLTWTASGSSGVTGYNIFRSQTSGGPYTQLNSGLIGGTSYVDTAVTAGQSYYYVATAVGQGSSQSSYSNEASATVSSP